MTDRLLKKYIKNHIYFHNKSKNLFETFFRRHNNLNNRSLMEISEKTISQDFQIAKEFISKAVKTEKSAFYCLNLLIENLSSYTAYLEIPSKSSNNNIEFALKKSFSNKGEEELTDDNVRSFITFTLQCLELLLKTKPSITSDYKSREEKIIKKIKQENT